jgi:hypothetical protein
VDESSNLRSLTEASTSPPLSAALPTLKCHTSSPFAPPPSSIPQPFLVSVYHTIELMSALILL